MKDVAVDWDTSIYLYAEPGDYIVTARKPKVSSLNKAADGVGKLPDGKKGVISGAARFVLAIPDTLQPIYAIPGDTTSILYPDYGAFEPLDTWFVGGITDENAREVSVKLDFLEKGKSYDAVIYADAPNACGLPNDAHLPYNPYAYTIANQKVTSKSTLKLKMAPCGGFAVSIRERK
ncbi:MAG: glycoside hydrolase family 97 C-terminal domain-containing protein [Bacteroidales bacterium]|nr:glycoside hydrolase family 97 C-terminal domain-containing protein [Bacteroidales bacterium]